MDELVMAGCPTKAEYVTLDQGDEDNKSKISIYKANRRMCIIMTLGQGINHGLAVIKKTKWPDHPNGLLHKAIVILMKKNKPSDVSAEIDIDSELEKL